MSDIWEYPAICRLLTQWHVRALIDGNYSFASRAAELSRRIGNKSYRGHCADRQIPVLCINERNELYFEA